MKIKDKTTYLAQVGLKHLGFDPGPLDGDRGRRTNAAQAEWEASLVVDGVAGRLVQIAVDQLGIKETSRNQGPGIAKYWSATSYPAGYTNREPYCAAFVCWAVREASDKGAKYSLPTSARAYAAMDWAKVNKGRGVQVVPVSKAQAGDIVVFKFSHIAIVEKVYKSSIHTIEGNTDGKGSREGDGVYRRVRYAPQIQQVIRIAP